MLEDVKGILFDLLVLGLPMFLFGNLTMLLYLMDRKYEWEENHQKIRKKRIKYIEYLEDLLMKKRRDQSKIDVD